MKNYTKDLDTFIFRRSWGELFLGLSDEDAGKLIKSIYRFTDGETASPDTFSNHTLVSVYSMIIKQLNYSSKRFVNKISELKSETEVREPTA